MSCVSADDTNFLPTGKKVGRHYLSGVSACSQYNIHKLASLNLPAHLALDAGGCVLDSRLNPRRRARPPRGALDWWGREMDGSSDEKTSDPRNQMAGRHSCGRRLQSVSRRRLQGEGFRPSTSARRVSEVYAGAVRRALQSSTPATRVSRKASPSGKTRESGQICSTDCTRSLQRLQILDNLHAFLFRQLAADHAVALWTVVEFMSSIRVTGQIGVEFGSAFKGIGVEAEFDGVVLLVSKIEHRRALGYWRKQCIQVRNGTVVEVGRRSPDSVMRPSLVRQGRSQFVRPVAVPFFLLCG